jgi:hypothetical protein
MALHRREEGREMKDPGAPHHPILHAMTERLLDWHEHTNRVAHREECSDALLVLAWVAFDRPLRGGCGTP